MSRGLALVGCMILLCPAAARAVPATRAIMPEGLHSVLSDDDYPKEAIRNEEQGNVAFRLDVGIDGRPISCVVTTSSGSSALDTATCQIMMERARFRPARDRKGRPTSDQVASTVRWVLPGIEDMPPRMQAAYSLWPSCVMGEAARLVPGDQPVEQIAALSFSRCAALEAIVAQETGQALPLEDARVAMIESFMTMLPKLRADLQASKITVDGSAENQRPPR